jgi:hypothetical protein
VSVPLVAADLASAPATADLTLKLTATPAYAAGGAAATASVAFATQGGGGVAPGVAQLLPAWPNPARFGTHFRFALPAAAAERATLTVVDASGRRVRTFSGPFAAGVNELAWDGNDSDGHAVRSGLYFYQLDVPGSKFSHRLVVVR